MLSRLRVFIAVVSVALLSVHADPPPDYYNGIEGLTGGALKSALHQRISNHTVIPYASLLDPLRVLYEDPSNSQNIILEYSLTSVSKQSTSWNREHLWPRARGDSDQAGPDDSDLFHVVPSDIAVNAERGNLYFDESNTSDPNYVIPAHPLAPQTSRDSDSWQPPPSQRGDIARALFYMEVRYDGIEPSTTDMELVSYGPSGSQMANLNTLLLWNDADPPDDAERRRNDLIYSDYQHNRNPFIDHPEWVQAIWGTGTPNGTGTQPIAQVSTLSSAATESPTASASLLVSLNQFAGPNGVTVSFSMSGTATTADYSVSGTGVTFDPGTMTGTVTIPANFNSAAVSIVPVADGIVEPTETAVVTVTAGNGYTVVPGASATAYISDNPALPAMWNFNSGAPFANPLPANSGSGTISFSGWHGSVTSFNGTSGLALALVDSAGNNSWIDFNFSMQGFTDLKISFYTRGTSSGFDVGTWSYSTDGVNFTTLPGVNTATRNTTFILRQVDFSSIAELNDAPNVTLRYTLSGATGNQSNNRIDDFTINANSFITGDQLRTVQLAVSDATASDTTGDPGVFAFRINGVANPGGLTVGFQLSGTATPPGLAGADYDLDGASSYDPSTRTGTIVIPEGASAALLRILPVIDDAIEGSESVIATIRSQPDAYIVGQNNSAIITMAEPPINDTFSHATVLNGASLSATGNNIGAAIESGEPIHAGYAGGTSVWWAWTAPADGSATISTAGSTFDTLLGIYTGSSVNALTLVASDTNSGGKLTSAARFATTAGTTYFIAVDGFNGATGTINLSIASDLNPPAHPVNDNFASAIALAGASANASGTNDFATKEFGEPNHVNNAGGKSVWWLWTAVSSGTTVVSTSGSNFDTLLAVYTGSSVNNLVSVASNNDFGSLKTSRVTFSATAGVTYALAVDGNFASSGSIALTITGMAPPPPNDAFANAIELIGNSPSTTGTNAGATKETGEPNHAGITGGKSVWWRWTAPMDTNISISTVGSTFDTILAVYTGSAVNALTTIASNDDISGTNASRVSIDVVSGTTYYIAVDGFGASSGNIVLTFTPPATNDDFNNAIVLSGEAPSTTGSNVGATKQSGEPNHAFDTGGHSVWWRWTAPMDGYASASTANSNFDTLLAVYTGKSVKTLHEVASNDQANGTNQSQVVFPVTAGVTYYIAVDGWRGDIGSIALAINGPLPPPEVSIFSFSLAASEATGAAGYFYVYLNGAQTKPITLQVNLGGTATAGVDYTLDVPVTGNTALITLAPGEDFKFIMLTPLTDDDPTEFDETIIPTLVPSTDYEIQFGTGGTITLHDDTPYNAAWAQQFPGFTGPDADPLVDFNGNGVVNLLEFAFNGDPVAGNVVGQSGLPLLPVAGLGIYPDPNDGNIPRLYPTITFNRRTDAPQLAYAVQTCYDLLTDNWNANDAVQMEVTTAGMPAGIQRVTFRSGHPVDGVDMMTPQFLRVDVIATPQN